MLLVLALLAFLFATPLAAQCTGIAVPANFGGVAGAAAGYADNFASFPETFIDQSRPATAAMDVSEIDFRMTLAAAPFSVRFVAFNPSGTSYTARNVSASMSFTPALFGVSQLYTATLNPPLHFQAGDLLGATFSSAGGGGLAIAHLPGRTGYLGFRSDAPAGTQLARDGAAISAGDVALAMEAPVTAPCEQLPQPEIFLPAVGDVVGAAHFTTDVIAHFRPRDGSAGVLPVQFTLRDRLGGNPRIATATLNSSIGSAIHPDSLTTLLSVPPPYFGSLDITFDGAVPGTETRAMSAAANISAPATAGGGFTGSAIAGVSCDGIGHEIAIPFHVSANHRLNIGIASAQLHSCGIFAPATSAEVWVNDGPHVVVPMPGESTQIGDITGSGGTPYGSIGVTDGVVFIRVTDEATRIAAYGSLLDNASQDSSVFLGTILQ